MTKLLCPDCRHENEPERIYCHNCGARLERGVLKKEREAAEVSAEESQAHLRKMLRPNRGEGKRIAFKVAKLILGALVVGLLIQMLLPPDLPPAGDKTGFAPMINMDLLSAIEAHNPPRLTYTQEQVNSYLASSVSRANSPAREGLIPIQRFLVRFEEGICRVDVVHSLFGLPLCIGSSYRVFVDQGKIKASSTGGSIGRLAIHPAIMDGLNILFHKSWQVVARERQQIARLAGIEFHPQSVTFVTVR